MKKIIFILIFSLISGTAFAALVIKGQVQVKNLMINTTTFSSGGGGEDIGAITKEDGFRILKEDGGALLK